MGMQSASVQQSPNQGSGKGMGQPMSFPQQQGMSQQNSEMPNYINNQQPINVVQQGGGGYGDGQYGPPLNQQPMGGQNGQPDASMMAPAVMPSRQQPMGKGGRNITMPGQGGQPRMGQPNAYSNTIQPWDNASIQPQRQSGKGKGY
jgi:hypothetical protein